MNKSQLSKLLKKHWYTISRDYANWRIRWLTCSSWWVEIIWDTIMTYKTDYYNNYSRVIHSKSQKQTWVFGIDIVWRTIWNSKPINKEIELKNIYNILKDNWIEVIIDTKSEYYISWTDSSMTWYKLVVWDLSLLKQDHNVIIIQKH